MPVALAGDGVNALICVDSGTHGFNHHTDEAFHTAKSDNRCKETSRLSISRTYRRADHDSSSERRQAHRISVSQW
jgi:hypothetical protein